MGGVLKRTRKSMEASFEYTPPNPKEDFMAAIYKIIGRACAASGVIGASIFAHWMNKQVQPIPKELRGDWTPRIKEVFLAKREQIRVIDMRMHDTATKERHVATVAALPANSRMKSTKKPESERCDLLSGFGYLFDSIYNRHTPSEHKPTFVFHYDKENPDLNGKPRLVFAGTLHSLSNHTARRNIVEGEYTLLPSLVPYDSSDNKVDVIITGTRSLWIGEIFKEKLLKDAAQAAAGPIQRCYGPRNCAIVYASPQNPLLEQTPVRVIENDTPDVTLAKVVNRPGIYSKLIQAGGVSVEPGKGAIGGIVLTPPTA